MKDIALITGASSGIGRQYALQLAARCKGMILLGQREEALTSLAAELGDQGVEVHCLVEDLGTTLGVARTLEAIRQKGPVSILINNAGFGNRAVLAECDLQLQQQMIALHCSASVALCRGALPFMREAGRGTVINVASVGAFLSTPTAAVYNASKAFLVSLSRSLAEELAAEPIAVQCLCPGYTRSDFHHRRDYGDVDLIAIPDSDWMSAEQVVTESLAALADEAAPVVVIPGEHNRQRARQQLQAQLDAL
ncbi:SDR family NAD(P)-dependent oxidoreductase [Spongiibacter nanhainus]|uniref:SDR family NAD(P)-dependent oxidoreductase n=1 Tax=Spongiibacter nanhainus TaxID=2794344 RepID=A0A7T4UQF7_9GAMM|nr:SDR family NAD(P)-dependent oxidoreductase [Spongiibacter nanhainus]QQD18636.1 SDR family NAD(P)-dependent oxidoreductase [Spongiibacter nanhainus]